MRRNRIVKEIKGHERKEGKVMATKKKDFAAADKEKYDAMATSDTKNTKTTTDTKKTKRDYNRLDPRDEAPEEYRFTARMPGEYGRFLNELAYQRRSTITAEIARLVKQEMDLHPEILASLDELNG